MARKKAEDLFTEVAKAGAKIQRPPTGEAAEAPPVDKDMVAFTVRLPRSQKDRLERILWERRGLRLAAGARAILTEWMSSQSS